jgi:hypothetical protein
MSAPYAFVVLHDFPPPDLDQAWREFLGRVELPSHYCAPEFFSEPFWDDKGPFAVLALHESNVVGVVTGIREGNEIQCGQPSRPQICLARRWDRTATLDALVQGLLTEAGDATLVSIYSWDLFESLSSHGFLLRAMEGDVVLDLTLGPEVLFRQLDKKRRNNVRFALKSGVEVFEASTTEDASAYHEVFCDWRRSARKRIVAAETSLETFESIVRLRANRRLLLARFSGNIIAGASLRFFPGGWLEYTGNVSREESLRLKPNDLLVWNAIEWGCSGGFPRFSLGGAHRFLREFGGVVAPIYRHRLDRTWLRRHDFGDTMSDWGRQWLKRMPKPVEHSVRRVLGKSRETSRSLS